MMFLKTRGDGVAAHEVDNNTRVPNPPFEKLLGLPKEPLSLQQGLLYERGLRGHTDHIKSCMTCPLYHLSSSPPKLTFCHQGIRYDSFVVILWRLV